MNTQIRTYVHMSSCICVSVHVRTYVRTCVRTYIVAVPTCMQSSLGKKEISRSAQLLTALTALTPFLATRT